MKTVDLFSGCGGMTKGFQNAGFDVVVAYDNWAPAIAVYRKNFDHPAHVADLTDPEVKASIVEMQPEVIIGGPPCQDFSTAGHQDESLGRAVLTIEFAKIVAAAHPDYFVMENVANIRRSGVLPQALEILRGAGYGITSELLDASRCGVPQSRKRFFLAGALGAPDDFLGDVLQRNLTPAPMTIHDYLGDSLGVEYYFRVPTNYNRRGVFSIHEPSVCIRTVDRPIPPGYLGHPSDPVAIGPEVRGLTVKERSYIQTFPPDFEFEGTKTNLNQMIGNAVPVNLASYVGRALMEYTKNAQRELIAQ